MNSPIQFIVVSCYTTSYQHIWCTKSFLVSNHHSFLHKDYAPGTKSTRWVAVTLLIWGCLTTDLDPTLGSQYSHCLTVLVWTNPRLTPQGLDDGSNQAPYTDPEPVQPAYQTQVPRTRLFKNQNPTLTYLLLKLRLLLCIPTEAVQ